MLNGSDSTDLDGTIVQYRFAVSGPNGESFDIISEQSITSYTFLGEGKWSISLTVIDEFGAVSFATEEKSVIIDTLPPEPGEDGKLTLEGIDSDGDGVRDDVERYIASLPLTSDQKREFLNYGRTIHQGISTAEHRDESITNTFLEIDNKYCLESYMTPEKLDTYSKRLLIKTYNTKDRIIAWVKAKSNFAGQIVTIEKNEGNYGAYCKN